MCLVATCLFLLIFGHIGVSLHRILTHFITAVMSYLCFKIILFSTYQPNAVIDIVLLCAVEEVVFISTCFFLQCVYI